MRARWGTVLRVAVSLGLIGYLLWKVDPRSAAALLMGAKWPAALLAVALGVGVVGVSACRWKVLVPPGVPYRALLALTFIGYFFNNFLPTNFGGDGMRVLGARPLVGGLGRSLASVFWDRLTGVAGLLSIGLGAYLLGLGAIRETAVRWAYPTLELGFAAAMAVFWGVPWERLRARPPAILASAGPAPGPGTLGRALAWSVAAQSLGIGCLYCLALSLGLSVQLAELLVFAPLVTFGTMLPVGISGLGVREGLMVYLLGLAGVPAPEALSLSLAWFALTVLVSLWGGVEYARWGRFGEGSRWDRC